MSHYSKREYDRIIDLKDDQKVELILKQIPKQVKSVIDIGCGNGLITNRLANHYDVLGVDVNPTKLKYVQAETMEASCDNINLNNHSHDLVFSSELLEHLDQNIYQSTLAEFERIAKRYILITVPNEESLNKLMVRCESCRKIYHKNGHLQSFNKDKLVGMFSNFRLLNKMEFGPMIRSYNSRLSNIKHTVTPSSSWIPKFWSKNQGISYTFCLYCGSRNEVKHHFHPMSFGLDMINIIVSKKHKSQLIALFERKST